MTRLLLAAGLVYLAATVAIRIEVDLLANPAPAREPRTLLDMYPGPITPAKVAYERRMLVAEWAATVTLRGARLAFALALPAFLVAVGRWTYRTYRIIERAAAPREGGRTARPSDHPPRGAETLTWEP